MSINEVMVILLSRPYPSQGGGKSTMISSMLKKHLLHKSALNLPATIASVVLVTRRPYTSQGGAAQAPRLQQLMFVDKGRGTGRRNASPKKRGFAPRKG